MGLTVCFTGHRKIPERDRAQLAIKTENEIRQQIYSGADRFRVGGAYGFDLLVEVILVKLRREFPHIRMELILPCRDQAIKWSSYNKLVYKRLLEEADHVEYLYERYRSGCMLARDRLLLQGSDLCIAYQRRSSGGTAYTVKQATKAGIPVIHLGKNPKTRSLAPEK